MKKRAKYRIILDEYTEKYFLETRVWFFFWKRVYSGGFESIEEIERNLRYILEDEEKEMKANRHKVVKEI